MMEFNENLIKPESIRKFLIHQVEEQSDLCDVTIKVDHWEKRFHRCVLIKSPFFDCVFKHEYKETQTGEIAIKIGTPVTVEMAIMFLYGKKPKVTTENAEIMMTLAEYFLIPNLKAACVEWLNEVEVTDENCLKLLQVASLFDFELPKCMEFVEGNLDSLFENEQFTDIDSDSVKYIFNKRRFSYISLDDRLKFLLRWTQANPIKRYVKAKEIVEILNFQDISPEVLKEFSNNPMYRKITEEKKIVAETTANTNNRHEVLITKNEGYGDSFWCLDLTRNRWFKLETATSDGQMLYSIFNSLKVQNSDLDLYFKQSYDETNILFFDFETCLFKTFPVVQSESGETFQTVDQIAIYTDVCIITENENVEITKKTATSDYNLDLQRQLGFMSFCSADQMLMMGQLGNRRISVETTNIHIGNLSNNIIQTKPLFTIREQVSKICLNNIYCVAFITDANKHIIVFDVSDCRMEFFEETTTYNDKLCSAENGFVIFNDERCIYLRRLQGLALESKYQKRIIEFTFTGREFLDFQMYFCKDRWYRYYRRNYEDNYEFEYIPHSEILAVEHGDGVAWRALPLPLEASQCHKRTLKQMYLVRLPKSKLRCDIECPHCDQLKKAKLKSRCTTLKIVTMTLQMMTTTVFTMTTTTVITMSINYDYMRLSKEWAYM